jgi:hypothetical protein
MTDLSNDTSDSALWDQIAADQPATDMPQDTSHQDRSRDEQGRFAPKAGEQEQDQEGAPFKPLDADPKPPTQGQEHQPTSQDPADPTLALPPKSWSPKAKAKWDVIDPELKAEIQRREADVDRGFQQYAGLAKYVDTATKAGTTLPEALDRYAAAEDLLVQDFTLGVAHLAQMAGVSLAQLVQDIQAREAQLAGQVPQPRQQARPSQPQQPDVRRTVEDVIQDRDAQSEIAKFFGDPKNRYAENVRPLMATFLTGGRAGTLQEAYDMACRADPAVWAIIQNDFKAPAPPAKQAAVKQARAASGSLTGSPPIANGKSGTASSPAAADAALWDEMGLS